MIGSLNAGVLQGSCLTHGIEPEVHGSHEQSFARPAGVAWCRATRSSSVGLMDCVERGEGIRLGHYMAYKNSWLNVCETSEVSTGERDIEVSCKWCLTITALRVCCWKHNEDIDDISGGGGNHQGKSLNSQNDFSSACPNPKITQDLRGQWTPQKPKSGLFYDDIHRRLI